MSIEDIHSCSYYCDRPECIRRQRDEIREYLEDYETLDRDNDALRLEMAEAREMLATLATYCHGLIKHRIEAFLTKTENGK